MKKKSSFGGFKYYTITYTHMLQIYELYIYSYSKKQLILYNILIYFIILVLFQYKANAVPVGDDQKQHLELTRRIINEVNKAAKEKLFPIPETIYSLY